MRGMSGRTIRTAENVEEFCAELANSCNVGRACLAAGISRSAAFAWRNTDPEFAARWAAAERIGVSALEDEARRRAFEGIDEPITHQGQITATTKRYSDTLAIFLLKAHDPDKYRESSRVEMSGSIELRRLDDAALDAEIAQMQARLAALDGKLDDSES